MFCVMNPAENSVTVNAMEMFEAMNAKCKWKSVGLFCPVLMNGKGEIFPPAWGNSIVVLEGDEWLYVFHVPGCFMGACFELVLKMIQA